MKKLMGISMIAAMAVLPMSANAARPVSPLDDATGGSNSALATTSYVQGAYNTIKTQFNNLLTDTNVTGNHSVITAGNSVAENLSALDTEIGGVEYTGDSITAAIAALQSSAGDLGSTKVNDAGNFTDANDSTLIKNKTVINAIKDIASQVDANETAISNEASAREQAVSAEASARAEAVSAEAAARASADTTLTNAINAVAASLNSSNTAADEKYATKVGTLATINASTVPVVTTWGQDLDSATTLTIKAPNAYQPGEEEEEEETPVTQDVGAAEDEVEGDGPDLDDLLGL